MKFIPEIRVRNGKVIEPGTGKALEAVPLLRSLEKRFSTEEEDALFYIIDEDGMERNSFDVGLIDRIGEEFRFWLKGGFRRAEFLMDALILGAEAAVMDSSTIISMKELKKATDMSDNVAFSIELREYRRWNDVPQDMYALSESLNSLKLHSVIFSCEKEADIPLKIFNTAKFIHGCAQKEGADGVILPYNIIPR